MLLDSLRNNSDGIDTAFFPFERVAAEIVDDIQSIWDSRDFILQTLVGVTVNATAVHIAGDADATVVLTRVAGQGTALLVEPF